MIKFSNKFTRWSAFPSFLLLLIITVIEAAMTPYFLSESYLSGFFGAFVPTMVVSIGQAAVLIGGGIDLSIGATLSLVNVTTIVLLGHGWNPMLAFLTASSLGLAFGVVNGFVISFLRVNPLMTTLATSSMAAGMALWIKPSPGGKAPYGLIMWYQQDFFSIPTPLIFVLIVFLLWLLFRMSPAGTQLYAVGNSMQKAYMSGVRVVWLRFFSYVFSSFSAAVAAIATTAALGSGNPFVGLSLTLNSVAACVIGGIALVGGIGDVLGAVFGAAFLSLVFITVLSARVSPYYQSLLSGLIILVSIVLTSYFRRKRDLA